MSMFTPVTGFLGGSLIGLAADALLLFNGDILGASGIVSSVVLNPLQSLREPKQHWKVVFLSTFLTTASLMLEPASSTSPSSAGRSLSTLGLSLAGLLVGFGTDLGNGCTSGHGICGLARLSRRSMAAVAAFMATGIATSSLLEAHKDGPVFEALTSAANRSQDGNDAYEGSFGLYVGAALALVGVLGPLLFHKKNATRWAKVPAAAASGVLFAAGLKISQMVVQAKVLGFLTLSGRGGDRSWDPTLVTVMGGGLLWSALGYQHTDTAHLRGRYVVPRRAALKRPVCGDDDATYDSCLPSSKIVDWQLLLGASMFGAGWGLAGYCPGPALYLAGVGNLSIVRHWWPAFVVGSYAASKVKQQQGGGGGQCPPAATAASTATPTKKAT